MTEAFFYCHSGLIVASHIPLPEWEAFSCKPRAPDVRITVSDGPNSSFPTEGSSRVGDSLHFAIEGVGGWQIEGGHTITLFPDAAAEPAELRLFTLGSARGALGYQRGFPMWHGSAVEKGGKAILFCGDAGAGKSTMAGAFCAQGWRLVADDLSRIEPGTNNVRIHPSSARIKLWREAIDRFGWQEHILQRDYFRDEKFHCSVEAHCAGEPPVPLAAIVCLEEGPDFALFRVEGHAALKTAMKQTLYRPEMLDALELWAQQGALAAAIVARSPVYRFVRPRDLDRLGKSVGAIQAEVFAD